MSRIICMEKNCKYNCKSPTGYCKDSPCDSEDEVIDIKTVAEHLSEMDEEEILCLSPECDFCNKPKCDAECIPAYEKMIRSWNEI